MIDFVIVFYNGNVKRLIDSIDINHRIRLFTHSKNPLDFESIHRRPNILIYDYRTNRGLTKSWNEGMNLAFAGGADGVVLINDDTYFIKQNESNLMADSVLHNDFVAADGLGFSCFGINRTGYDLVGCFDENIFPAYYEDCDYAYRIGLAKLNVGGVNVDMYHEGSGTIKKDPKLNNQNLHTMMATQSYYKRKWGGLNGHEINLFPFNDFRYTYYIHPLACREPYPGYNRIDQYIVKI